MVAKKRIENTAPSTDMGVDIVRKPFSDTASVVGWNCR
jgi:hypothetical protein